MFLIGGPAFSGTTLLAHLLNQGETVCLDEPDFERPGHGERGIPLLQSLFPGKNLPPPPQHALSYADAFGLIQECQVILTPVNLGIKTCNRAFLEYAKLYRARRFPVIAIVRDIRDALVRPLPPWLDEAGLNQRYRLIWNHRELYDLCLRYEDLVREPEDELKKIACLLGQKLVARRTWDPASVHPPMLKLDRHESLARGELETGRVGLWKHAGCLYSAETLETAALMGYSALK